MNDILKRNQYDCKQNCLFCKLIKDWFESLHIISLEETNKNLIKISF